jgi:hypothetical protein
VAGLLNISSFQQLCGMPMVVKHDNLSAKWDKRQLGEALHSIQIIGLTIIMRKIKSQITEAVFIS